MCLSSVHRRWPAYTHTSNGMCSLENVFPVECLVDIRPAYTHTNIHAYTRTHTYAHMHRRYQSIGEVG
jgi:hypothetical protein